METPFLMKIAKAYLLSDSEARDIAEVLILSVLSRTSDYRREEKRKKLVDEAAASYRFSFDFFLKVAIVSVDKKSGQFAFDLARDLAPETPFDKFPLLLAGHEFLTCSLLIRDNLDKLSLVRKSVRAVFTCLADLTYPSSKKALRLPAAFTEEDFVDALVGLSTRTAEIGVDPEFTAMVACEQRVDLVEDDEAMEAVFWIALKDFEEIDAFDPEFVLRVLSDKLAELTAGQREFAQMSLQGKIAEDRIKDAFGDFYIR